MGGSLIFNPVYHVENIDDEGLLLISEIETFSFTGNVYSKTATLVDGKRTTDEIVDQLIENSDSISMIEAYFALEILKQQHVLIDADLTTDRASEAFWRICSPSQNENNILVNATVGIINLTSVDTGIFGAALTSTGITLSDDSSLTIVISENYLESELVEINTRFLREKKAWMLVKPIGTIIWIGPIFNHENTGCYECLSQRILSNREVESFIQQQGYNHTITTSRGSLPTTINMTAELCALEIKKWFLSANQAASNEGYVTSFNFNTLDSEKHQLIKRPQCPSCAIPKYEHEISTPIKLLSQKKKSGNDAGYRVASPEETFNKYKHHVSPITGVVNSLRKSESNNALFHSYVAGHNTAVRHRSFWYLLKGLRSKSAGKGVNETQAKVSALCEAIERYSGLYQGYEQKIVSSFNDIQDVAIHPNECMLFSEHQYDDRENWNKVAGNFQHVPARLDPDEKIDWTPVYSLTSQSFKYLPTAYCYFNYWSDKETAFCAADSNGNAAGNTFEEAILQGIFELVERDSVAIWWYNRLKRPIVDLSSFNNPYIDDLVNFYSGIHRDIWVLDLTSDLGIPVFTAISRRNDKPVEDILFGFGAHIDAKIALMRALTELNQFMPGVLSIDMEGKGEYAYKDPHIIHWWKTATLKNQSFLAGDKRQPHKWAADYPDTSSTDILEDIEFCKATFEKKGMELLVLNQTRADIGLPVAKVFVPGLRHFWKRLGPGRLYSVPVEMGWLEKPIKEKNLNPIPMFV